MLIKKILITTLAFIIIAIISVFVCNIIITNSTKDQLYSDTSSMPYNKVGLLLGTSKYTLKGYKNLYYKYRIQAAAKLLKEHKIKYLIVSGDNMKRGYNEPVLMRTDLMKEGIDSTVIFLDYAGFRTFDSVVRSKEVFGQKTITIISQKFHNERAVFLASREGISAVGFNAKDVNPKYGQKTNIREKLARVKVFIDFFLRTEPKFLGKKVLLPD